MLVHRVQEIEAEGKGRSGRVGGGGIHAMCVLVLGTLRRSIALCSSSSSSTGLFVVCFVVCLGLIVCFCCTVVVVPSGLLMVASLATPPAGRSVGSLNRYHQQHQFVCI